MSSKRSLQKALGLVATSAFLLASSCSGGDYAILVRVAGSPSDTVSLYATAKLGDAYAMSGMDIAPPLPLDMVGIRLPADKSGQLTVEVSALGSDQCKSASGTVTVDLSQGRGQEVTVNLSALSPRRCSLIINQSGEGTVTPSPTGTSCGSGCYDYNQNDTVVLKFAPTGKSYGAQTYVSGGAAANGVCDGLNDCSVKLARRVQVDAKFQPRLCSASKWCWYNPLPQGNALYAVWGTSAQDIWAVGDAGTAMHFDGQNWSLQDPGTGANLNGVWTGSAGNAVVVGDGGIILRWNGSTFTKETSPTTNHLNSVWGSSSSDIYAVGDSGTILHSNGGSWVTQPSNAGTNNLARVFGSGAQNVWAVGQAGTVVSTTGAAWTKTTHPTLTTLRDVFTSGVNDVWIAAGTTGGDCGTSRWDGTSWKTNNICSAAVSALGGSGPTDVWSGSATRFLSRYTSGDPTKPTSVDSLGASLAGNLPTYVSAWSAAPGDVYFTTLDGNVVRRVADPGGTQLTGPLPNMSAVTAMSQLIAIGGSAASMYLFYDDGTTYVSDGKRITPIKTKSSRTLVYDAYTAPTGEVFIAGNSGIVERYNAAAGTWTQLKAGSTPATVDVLTVGGSSANNFWAGTSAGFIYYYANQVAPSSAVNVSAYPGSIWSVWGRSDTDGWAVGASGTVVRLNKGTLNNQTVTLAGTTTLYAVAGPPSPSTHVWIAGQNGLLLRSPDGVSWTKMNTGITTSLFSIVALSESDVWIAGSSGVLFHYDGATLKQITGQFGTRSLAKLYSPGPNDMWLVGGGNAVWRYMP